MQDDQEILRTVTAKAIRRIVPSTTLMFVLSFLDRVNVGFAKQGLQHDTGMDYATFALGLSLFGPEHRLRGWSDERRTLGVRFRRVCHDPALVRPDGGAAPDRHRLHHRGHGGYPAFRRDFGPWAGFAGLCLAASGIVGLQPIYVNFPMAYLSGRDAAAGLGIITSLGALGGFVAPNLQVWAEYAFGSPAAGLYAICGVTALNIVLIF